MAQTKTLSTVVRSMSSPSKAETQFVSRICPHGSAVTIPLQLPAFCVLSAVKTKRKVQSAMLTNSAMKPMSCLAKCQLSAFCLFLHRWRGTQIFYEQQRSPFYYTLLDWNFSLCHFTSVNTVQSIWTRSVFSYLYSTKNPSPRDRGSSQWGRPSEPQKLLPR